MTTKLLQYQCGYLILTEKCTYSLCRLSKPEKAFDGMSVIQLLLKYLKINKTYTDIFPNATFQYNIKENKALELYYARGIQRVTYEFLYPFEQKISETSSYKGNEFLNLLVKEDMTNEGIIRSDERHTTTKFRVFGNNAQMLRVDEEHTNFLNKDDYKELIGRIQHIFEEKDIDVVIFQDYDKGVITPELIAYVVELALEKNIPVVNVTQCISGSVLLGHYETSHQLKKIGVIDGKDITTESAIAKLQYLIGENSSKNDLRKIFETPLRGEMS